jgi:hypothetical protein
MTREKKFASPGGAKEMPAGRLKDMVIENVIRPRGQCDSYRQKNGSFPLSKTRSVGADAKLTQAPESADPVASITNCYQQSVLKHEGGSVEIGSLGQNVFSTNTPSRTSRSAATPRAVLVVAYFDPFKQHA